LDSPGWGNSVTMHVDSIPFSSCRFRFLFKLTQFLNHIGKWYYLQYVLSVWQIPQPLIGCILQTCTWEHGYLYPLARGQFLVGIGTGHKFLPEGYLCHSLTVMMSWPGSRALSVMEQPLVLSYLILSTMPLPSYQMNYLTLIWFQFGCYETALYLIFYILLLFGLVDIIIRFDSCLALLHTAYTQTLSLFSQTIFLLSYFLICSFFHILSSYLLISDSSDSRIISHWRISGLYLIGW